MKLSVSILSKSDDYKKTVKKLNKTTSTYLHLDIMDNTFTNTFSFDYKTAKKIAKLNKNKLDIHIMSSNLDNILDDYIKLKPEIISFQVEAVNNIEKYINKIKENNIKVGLAINPDTNVEEIKEYLDKIDVILVMSVYAGKGGQTFIKDVIPKLEELYKIKDNYNYIIEIDGGINDETIKFVKDYIYIAVSGSYIVNSDNYQDKIDKLFY